MHQDEYQRRVRSVDWGRSEGAYGSGFPLADHLVDIVSDDPASAQKALAQILGHVRHQEVLEEIAPDVASVLIQALEIDELPSAVYLLQGVLELIRAAWSIAPVFGFYPRTRDFNGRPIDLVESAAAASAYDELCRRLMQAIADQTPPLLLQLSAEDDRVRALASRTLAHVAPWGDAERIGEALLGATDSEGDPVASAAHLLALALVAARAARWQEAVVERAIRVVGQSEALSGAMALAAWLCIDPRVCIRESRTQIRAALHQPRVEHPAFVWGDGQPAGLVAEALGTAEAAEEDVVELLLDGFLAWLEQSPAPKSADSWAVEYISSCLIERLFREHRGRRDFLTRDELNPLQRSVLARVRGYAPPALSLYPFRWVGIRNPSEDGPRLLGLEEGGLDQEMLGLWEDRVVRWPIWKWWHQTNELDGLEQREVVRGYVLSRMRLALTADQIWIAALDAVEGAYSLPHAPFVRLVAGHAAILEPKLHDYLARLDSRSSGRRIALAAFPLLTLLLEGSPGSRARVSERAVQLRALVERIEPADLKEESRRASSSLA